MAAHLGISLPTLRKYESMGLSDCTREGLAAFRAQNPSIYKPRSTKVPKSSTAPRHWLVPSTHAVWYLAELARDLRSFPDWGSLWDDERKKRAVGACNQNKRQKWQSATREKRDEINARIRAYRATEEAKAKRRAYKRKRVELDPSIKVQDSLRTRLRKFIRGKNKSGIRNLLGCSWLEFRRHIEAQFRRGMSWENYGSHWHIDHILPCASFDHTDAKQIRQCWHFTNLRPLEAEKNLAKGAKIEDAQLNLLIPH